MVEDASNMDTARRPSRIGSVEPGESLRDSVSIEIMPPLKGQGAGTLVEFLEGLGDWRPRFVSVTYHQAEQMEVTSPEGEMRRITRRKKPGSMGICSMIRDRFDLEVLPHVICGGFSRLDSEDYLIDLDYVGMRTLLVIRGDGQMGGPFRPATGGHEHAVDLVEQIMALNRGEYVEEVAEPATTAFRVGVGAYPEVHAEARDLEHDLETLARKERAGASFAITQMFFDNDAYFDFVEAARGVGITMPIIPGLKVVTRRSHVERLPEIFSIRMPPALVEAVASCADDEEVRSIGIDHTLAQASELHQSGVPGVHLFTMNDLDTTKRVVAGLQGGIA